MHVWQQISWRHTLFVAVYSVCLFLVLSGQRIVQDIDMYQLRTALHIDNFNTRQHIPRGELYPLSTTPVTAARHRAAIGDLAQHRLRMITFTLDPVPTGLDRRIIVVAIDNKRIYEVEDNRIKSTYEVIIPPYITITPQSEVMVFAIPDRETTPPPITVQSLAIGDADVYRWSRGQSGLTFLGIGGGWWQLHLKVTMQHPDNQPFAAHVQVGNRVYADLPTDRPGFRVYQYLVDPAQLPQGDMQVHIQSELANAPNDVRELGIPTMEARVEPITSTWWSTMPSLRLAALIGIAVCASMTAMLVGFPGRTLGVIVATTLGLALFIDRNFLASWYPNLLLMTAFTTLTVPLWYRLIAWLLPDQYSLGWYTDLLVWLIVGSIWLKAGGILFPYMVPIDISWHMDKVREVWNTGNIAKFYLPGSFSESVMPVTEWGAERPMIPYSPFYHFFSILYLFLPWRLETSAMMVSVIMDVSRIVLIAVIARLSGLSTRVSIIAATLYAITPMTFLLHSWGNTPTTTGLWWTLITTVALLVWGKQLNNRRVFAIITGITVLTMLIYTVTAVFHVLFVMLVALLLWIVPDSTAKSSAKPLLLATFGGLLIAIVLYYGQYIMPIIERTIPYFVNITVNDASAVGVNRPGLSTYFANYTRLFQYSFSFSEHLYYGLFIPMLLTVPGFILLRRIQPLWTYMSAWFVIAVLFMFVGMRISMVDKQIFYILPIVCICNAVVFERWWRRGTSGRLLSTMILIFTLWSALQLWVARIENSPVRWQ